MKSPFVFDGNLTLTATFPLPTDGTPDSMNALVVRITLPHEESSTAEIMLLTRSTGGTLPARETAIIGNAVPIETLANALYGVARLRTKRYLELIP